MKLINKIKNRFFSLFFKNDLDLSLKKAEQEKFRIISALDKQSPVQLLNFAKCKEVTAGTYQELHGLYGYANNNWAFELGNEPEINEGKVFFEFGAGNGLFTEHLLKSGKKAFGVDLINPRSLPYIITGDFQDAFSSDNFQNSDVVYSADFLEHLEVNELEDLLGKWSKYNKRHIHVIACYDDNVSHKTVFEPHLWALIFSRYFASVEIRRVHYRRYPNKKLAVLLACRN